MTKLLTIRISELTLGGSPVETALDHISVSIRRTQEDEILVAISLTDPVLAPLAIELRLIHEQN